MNARDEELDLAGHGVRRDPHGAEPELRTPFPRNFARFLVLWLGMLVAAFALFGFLLWASS